MIFLNCQIKHFRSEAMHPLPPHLTGRIVSILIFDCQVPDSMIL